MSGKIEETGFYQGFIAGLTKMKELHFVRVFLLDRLN